MSTQYKVICDSTCWTPKSKTRKVEKCLDDFSKQGWEFVSMTPVLFLGIDVGFYLILKRELSEN